MPKQVKQFRCYGNLLHDFTGYTSATEIFPMWQTIFVALPESKSDNSVISLKGLPKSDYSKVKGLDLAAIQKYEEESQEIPDVEV